MWCYVLAIWAGSARAQEGFRKDVSACQDRRLRGICERGIEVLAEGGRVGAITSRTVFFLSSHQAWREQLLLNEAPLRLLADLGAGIMDAATWSRQQLIVWKGEQHSAKKSAWFSELSNSGDKATALSKAVRNPTTEGPQTFDLNLGIFRRFQVRRSPTG